MNARMGLRIGTLVAVVLLSLLALDRWRAQQEMQPLSWKSQYQSSLWTPMHDGTLTLKQVEEVLGEGQLWMISADGEPGLVSRYPLESDGQQWRVQATIKLDEQQTASLVKAQAWQADMPDQPVARSVGEALLAYPIARMGVQPEEPLVLSRITATFGPADWKMPVEAGEAWIYGRAGAVVSVSDEQAYSIMFGLRQESIQ